MVKEVIYINVQVEGGLGRASRGMGRSNVKGKNQVTDSKGLHSVNFHPESY